MKTVEAAMRSVRAGSVALLYALIGLCATTGSAATVMATTEPFRLSIKHDGIRPSTGDEACTCRCAPRSTRVRPRPPVHRQSPRHPVQSQQSPHRRHPTGSNTPALTHTTYTNGVAGKIEAAAFIVTGRDVPFGAGDVVTTGYTGVYDGQSHGIGVTVAEGIAGVAKRYATNPSAVFTEELPTIKDVGSLTVWCEISAPGYITQTNSATVTITPRPVSLTSKSDAKVYDGTPLTAHEVAVGGDGFVDDEGAAYAFTGEQTTVGTSENTFTYALNGKTSAGNYAITTVNGTLTVTKASIGGGEGGGGLHQRGRIRGVVPGDEPELRGLRSRGEGDDREAAGDGAVAQSDEALRRHAACADGG